MKAGRSCPIDYVLTEDMFIENEVSDYNTIYVVGGLYGNIFALEEIENIVKNGRKNGEKSILVFNGDSHWFDKCEDTFFMVEKKIMNFITMQGNVEAEMTRDTDIGVGCGCAYPSCVDDATVERSNRIHAELKKITDANLEIKERMKERPKVKVLKMGNIKICITHGDEKLLGGWGCSVDSLSNESRRKELKGWMDSKGISIMAVSHTCSPVFWGYEVEKNKYESEISVINNGAAGLPNFCDGRYGIITRISESKSDKAIYRTKVREVYVEGIAVKYDNEKFIKWFDKVWPTGSPAEISYRDRIVNSTDVSLKSAVIGNIDIVE